MQLAGVGGAGAGDVLIRTPRARALAAVSPTLAHVRVRGRGLARNAAPAATGGAWREYDVPTQQQI